ncbi:piggyBac transposable element-derived protein 4-like [Portunus trituberculatus]|uniref:piggyBac transposable element-derived protein 4-like n=1 Tax=Portunus trituberculatus TaxID=210409 RepID=UPI001E1D1203|nr:piggyBac transposable element-derived protein 4-like [Portunus trituberculatus]
MRKSDFVVPQDAAVSPQEHQFSIIGRGETVLLLLARDKWRLLRVAAMRIIIIMRQIIPFRPSLKQEFANVHPGIIAHHESDPMSILQCFKLFFDSDIVSSLCSWTNTRATHHFRDNPTSDPHRFVGRTWVNVTEDEMYVFFALQLLMGLNSLPNIANYCNILCQGPPVFTGRVMSRNRYMQILCFLRFSDPDCVCRGIPMTRLDAYFNKLREKCTMYLDPGENFAVDEALLLFKGCIYFRQYIKNKRKRFRMKLFALCPRSLCTRGYTWNFCLYTPTLFDEMNQVGDLAMLNKSERVPVYLMGSLLDEGRHVVLDNWYSSLQLAEYLLRKNTPTTGTIQANRGVPENVTCQRLAKKQAVFVRRDNVLVTKFNDCKVVHVMTTKYEGGCVEKTRHFRGGAVEMVKNPQ